MNSIKKIIGDHVDHWCFYFSVLPVKCRTSGNICRHEVFKAQMLVLWRSNNLLYYVSRKHKLAVQILPITLPDSSEENEEFEKHPSSGAESRAINLGLRYRFCPQEFFLSH